MLHALHNTGDGFIQREEHRRARCLCIFAREQADGSTKMSLRSLEPYDITDVAQEFGGGGHAQAAGATVYLPLDEAIARVVARMEKELEQAE